VTTRTTVAQLKAMVCKQANIKNPKHIELVFNNKKLGARRSLSLWLCSRGC
jgi:hypothetical protein